MRISQVMIVKNEEKNIERALRWARKIVSEQIVVDTGSTDNTALLASELGARVLRFDWIDDFSAARNFALEKCTGDWILFLDADEYFTEQDAEKLPGILRSLEGRDCDAVRTALLNLDDRGEVFSRDSQIRILKNKKELRYLGRIHECLENRSTGLLRLIEAEEALSILHDGYAESVLSEKLASERNRRLLLRELDERPEDPVLLGYCGDDSYARRDWGEAADYYKRAVFSPEKPGTGAEQRFTASVSGLLSCLQRMEEPEEELRAVYEKAVRLLPEEADFDYLLGRYYLSLKKYREAKSCFEGAAEKLERSGAEGRSRKLSQELPAFYSCYAESCLYCGERNRAVELSSTLLRADKMQYRALTVLLSAFRGDALRGECAADAAAVLGFLEKLYDFTSLRDRMLLHRAAGDSGFSLLRELLLHSFTEEERQSLF